MALNVDHLKPDIQRWFELHGELYTGVASRLDTKVMLIDQKCLQLTMGGKCRIYKERPEVCKAFLPGNLLCKEAVVRQRMSDQVVLIMEAMDDG